MTAENVSWADPRPVFRDAPAIIHAEELRKWPVLKEWNGTWTACRPVSGGGLRDRFRYAWLVFTGRADALVWFRQ